MIERKIDQLRRPGRGQHLAQLGQLVLHQHALLIVEAETQQAEELPLAGLEVRFEQGQSDLCVYVTLPDGRVRLQEYPRRLHNEQAVRRFTVRVQNAVADENAFQKDKKSRIAASEQELQTAQDETAAIDTARQQLDQVARQQRQNTQLKTARADLQKAFDRWQTLTGRRPR